MVEAEIVREKRQHQQTGDASINTNELERALQQALDHYQVLLQREEEEEDDDENGSNKKQQQEKKQALEAIRDAYENLEYWHATLFAVLVSSLHP